MNRDWYQVGPGDGMWALFDPKDPSYIWSTSTNSDTGQVYLFNEGTKQVYEVSPDAESNGETAPRNLRYRFNWDSPIAFTSDGKALLGGNVVFESADRGQNWTVISPDLTRNDASKQGDTRRPDRQRPVGRRELRHDSLHRDDAARRRDDLGDDRRRARASDARSRLPTGRTSRRRSRWCRRGAESWASTPGVRRRNRVHRGRAALARRRPALPIAHR